MQSRRAAKSRWRWLLLLEWQWVLVGTMHTRNTRITKEQEIKVGVSIMEKCTTATTVAGNGAWRDVARNEIVSAGKAAVTESLMISAEMTLWSQDFFPSTSHRLSWSKLQGSRARN